MKAADGVIIGGVVVGLFAVVYLFKKVGAGVAVVGDVATTKLSPYSDKNIIYDNVIGGAGRAITGNKSWSLGTWIYDATH